MPAVKILSSPESLAASAAEHILHTGTSAINQRGRFTFVLAGGSTPMHVYSLLGRESNTSGLDWERVYIFWGDERCVPSDHTDSNFRAAKESLLDNVPLPEKNIHRIPSEMPPEEAARLYQAQLKSSLSGPKEIINCVPAFDLILLGMGEDGHTASLFPCSPALEERNKWAVAVTHKNPPPPLVDRITLTLPVINNASHVVFLVSGRKKAHAFEQVFSKDKDSHPLLPAALVQPRRGDLTWLIDRAASEVPDMGAGSN